MSTRRFSSLYRADPIPVSVGAMTAATIVSRLIGLLRTTALAWMIPQAQFGLFGVALLAVNVLVPICSAGLYEGVMRYAPLHESQGTLRRFVSSSSAWLIGITAVSALILFSFAAPCSVLLFTTTGAARGAQGTADAAAPVNLMHAAILCVVALAAYQSLIGLLKGLRLFRAIAVAEVLSAVLFTVLALAVAGAGYATASALIASYAVACLVAVVLLAPGLIVRCGSGFPPADHRHHGESRAGTVSENRQSPTLRCAKNGAPPGTTAGFLSFSVWAALAAVAWHALAYFPMWYLLKVTGSETVGAFHAVRTITQLVQVGAVVLTGVVAAHVTRVWEHEGREPAIAHLTTLTKGTLVLFLIGANALSVCRPWVMRIFPSTFDVGAAAYDPLVLFFALVGVVGLVAVRLSLVKKTRLTFLAWLVGTGVNVIASYLLIQPSDGSASAAGALVAAAWAGVAGVTAALGICVALATRERLGLDRPTLLLAAATFSLGLGWALSLPILALLLLVASTSRLFFSPHERVLLRKLLGGLQRR